MPTHTKLESAFFLKFTPFNEIQLAFISNLNLTIAINPYIFIVY